MATILSFGNSEGTRRCDATCHDATETRCACICGGRYHGGGGKRAAERLTEDVKAGRWGKGLAELAATGTIEVEDPELVPPHARQLPRGTRRVTTMQGRTVPLSAGQLDLLEPA